MNISLKETIDYVLEQVYVHNKLHIIFRRLLEKITTENLFQLNSKFFLNK